MPEEATRRRSDARRNEESLLEAAAAAFIESGVEARVRDIATRAGVGVGTVYRHFPTRADLVVAVYKHQIDACVRAGEDYRDADDAYGALAGWIDMLVDFLVTKHGLAAALRSDQTQFEALHGLILERLLPACAQLLEAARDQVRPEVGAFELMLGVGNLCAGPADDPRYDARKMVGVLVAGLRREG